MPEFAIMVGNPAKQIGWMSEAGEKMDFSQDTIFKCTKSSITYKLNANLVTEI